jgi:hypothetical protein
VIIFIAAPKVVKSLLITLRREQQVTYNGIMPGYVLHKTLSLPISLFLALAAGSTAVRAESFNFKTPSGNIFCAYGEYEGVPEVRCDIREFAPSGDTRPADCDLDWGGAFAVAADSARGAKLCAGDTVATPDAETLPYDATWERKGITCSSAKTGLTCRNSKGHGFFLSRAKQEVF